MLDRKGFLLLESIILMQIITIICIVIGSSVYSYLSFYRFTNQLESTEDTIEMEKIYDV